MTEELLIEDYSIELMTFSEFMALNEVYHNFLPKDVEKKRQHAHEVHALIQNSYASQGGIKGTGFASPEDMIHHIPMWKIAKHNGKVVAASMYKDADGRKRVAAASDGSEEGKSAAGKMMSSDLKQRRAHMEVSGKSLSFLKKIADIKPHLHSFESAKEFHEKRGDKISRPSDDDKEILRHPELKDHMYSRMIGGELHTKVMLGSRGNHITEMTKDEEIQFGKDSTLKQGKHQYGNWGFDAGIHGPARAKERQPNWKEDDWQDLLHRSHEALTDTSKQIVERGKPHFKLKGPSAVMVYSKKRQQGVILRVSPTDNNNPKSGGTSRVETIPPSKHSYANEGTHRIIIEGVTILQENIVIIE